MTSAPVPRRRQKAHTGALSEAGSAVSERRLQLGLTQSDLADLAGVGLSSVRALEAGHATVTLTVALAVLDALGLAVGVAPRPTLQALPGVTLLDARTSSR